MKRKMNITKSTLAAGAFAALLTLAVGGSAAYLAINDVESVSAQTIENTPNTNVSSNEPELLPEKLLPERPADTKAPVITANDMTIEEGTTIDVLEDVTVTDNVDKDLQDRIVTEGTVGTTPGTYTVTFSVTDRAGNTGSAEKTVTVTPTPVVEEPVEVPVEATPAQSAQAQSAPTESYDTASAQAETPAALNNTAPSYSPMTMYLAGTAISYQNGGQGQGQEIIDSNSNVISTWGGVAAQSGNDGMNTHFIGHNPGIFSTLFSVGQGSQITVTDGNGTPTVYTVSTILTVDDSAIAADGTDYWNLITGTGGGERITLQTCIDDVTNRIVIAYA